MTQNILSTCLQYESMIQSMTKQEREQPELLAKNPSRRWGAANGGGSV